VRSARGRTPLTDGRTIIARIATATRTLGRRLDHPFWTLVSIRAAFWLGAAVALLWAPIRSGFPPFRAYDALTDLLFGAFAQWDAQWFLRVAEHGYDIKEATSFFPVYPLAVSALGFVVGSSLVAGVLISLVAAGVGAAAVAALTRPLLGPAGARDTVLLLALYPVAFVFTAPQSDGLFLALAAGSILYATRGRPWLAGALGAVAVGTRITGLALVPALAVILWPSERSPRAVVRVLPALLPLAGLAAYMLYLAHRWDDALAFVHAQQSHWHREAATLGPIGGFWEAFSAGGHGAVELLRHLPRQLGEPAGFPERDHLAAWNVVHLLLLLAAMALTVVAWRRLGPALGLYSATTLALVLAAPPDTFPLPSLPRYLLGDFPLFMALAAALARRPREREIVLMAFAAIGAVAAVAYSRAVWIG
jgi:hypothetical protein